MPFETRFDIDMPQRDFEEIDLDVVTGVFPNLIPELSAVHVDYYTILPNGRPSLFLSDAGLTNTKDPRKYFALSCLDNNISWSEIEMWLDICIREHTRKHADEKTRIITADQESSLRFDRRKPIYTFDGIYRMFLVVREI